MYALKLRKIDLPLLTLLNDGIPPEIPKKPHYLVVTPGESSVIVSEKDFDENYASRISTAGPFLMKLNKTR